jgi:Rha family phage regulatory protein
VPVVNSRDVAEKFGKRHDNVLRDIDALIRTSSDLRTSDWFREVRTDVEGGNSATLVVRSFDLTRDGFTLLAMGWTGPKALAFKIQYIAAARRVTTAARDTRIARPAGCTHCCTLRKIAGPRCKVSLRR